MGMWGLGVGGDPETGCRETESDGAKGRREMLAHRKLRLREWDNSWGGAAEVDRDSGTQRSYETCRETQTRRAVTQGRSH